MILNTGTAVNNGQKEEQAVIVVTDALPPANSVASLIILFNLHFAHTLGH